MIRFASSQGMTGGKVIFTPRPDGVKRGWKETERDLLYGFVCQYCGNPILFAFLTEEKLTLGRYEETRVVSGDREFKHWLPSSETEYKTAYEIEWMGVPAGKRTGIERVYMKNHVVRPDVVGQSNIHETGDTCCPYAGVHSLKHDLLIRDVIILGGFPEHELKDYRLPRWPEFEEMINKDTSLWFAQGFGSTPPMVMVRHDWIKDEKGRGQWRGKLLPYKRKGAAGDEEELDIDNIL